MALGNHSRKVAVSVIGCGYWGPNLIRNLRSIPGCTVPMMCDLALHRLDRLMPIYPDIDATSDFRRILKDPDTDAVAIATPLKSHFPLAKAALLAGKHVLVEKPMACSSAECEELIHLARRHGLVLMVGHTFLYSSPVRKIAEIIRNGDIGDVRCISSRRLNLGLFQQDINVVWDLAPHDLSIILHVLDCMPETVNCQGNAHVTRGIEDVSSLSLTFPDHRFATVQTSWLEPRKVREMTFAGSRRMIVYNDVEPHEKIRIYDVRVEPPPHYDTFAEFHYSYHYGDSYIPRIDQEEPLRAEMQHFVGCIRSLEQPMTCGERGLDLVRLLEAATRSLRENGAPVKVRDPISSKQPSSQGRLAPVSRARRGAAGVPAATT